MQERIVGGVERNLAVHQPGAVPAVSVYLGVHQKQDDMGLGADDHCELRLRGRSDVAVQIQNISRRKPSPDVVPPLFGRETVAQLPHAGSAVPQVREEIGVAERLGDSLQRHGVVVIGGLVGRVLMAYPL